MAKSESIELTPILEWHERIGAAERIKKDYRDLYRWDRFIDEYKGFWNLPTGEIPELNFVFSWLKTELAALYTRDPHMEVTPLKRATIEQAELKELALADIWRRKKLKREFKKCIIDADLVGHAWMKVGYNGDFETMVDSEGTQMVTVKKDDFFVYRIPWTHMLFDNHNSIDPPHDCQWIAHEFWLPEEDFKKKKEYKFKKEVSAQTLKRFHTTQESRRRIKLVRPPHLENLSTQKFVQLYEIWDKKEKKVYIVAPGVTKGFIHEKDWPFEKLQEFPFSHLCFNPINDEPYGIPDVYTFERQVVELMKLDFIILDHVKKNNRQLITEPGNIDADSRTAYEEGQTGVLLEAKNPDRIFTVPYANVQQDIFALRRFLIENITNTSGQSAQQRGASQQVGTRTFKELALINEESKNRREEKVDSIEDFNEDIARKISALIDEFADEDYFIKVNRNLTPELQQSISQRPSAQEPGASTTFRQQGTIFSATGDDFGGMSSEFDIQIKHGSTVPLNRDNKTDLLRFVIENGVAAGAVPGGPLIGMATKELLKEFDLPQVDLALEAELKAQQEQKQSQSEQLEKAQALESAEQGSTIQIQAEREADRKEQTRVKQMLVALKEQELRLKELELQLKQQQADKDRDAKARSEQASNGRK